MLSYTKPNFYLLFSLWIIFCFSFGESRAIATKPTAPISSADASSSPSIQSIQKRDKKKERLDALARKKPETRFDVSTPNRTRKAKGMIFLTPSSNSLQNSIYIFHDQDKSLFRDIKLNVNGKILTPKEFISAVAPFTALIEDLKKQAKVITLEDFMKRLEPLETLALSNISNSSTSSSSGPLKESCQPLLTHELLLKSMRPLLELKEILGASENQLLFPRYIGQSQGTQKNPERSLLERATEHAAAANSKKTTPALNKFYTLLREQAALHQTDAVEIPMQALAYNIHPSQLSLFEAYFIQLFNSVKGHNGLNSKNDGFKEYTEFLASDTENNQDISSDNNSDDEFTRTEEDRYIRRISF